MIHPARTAFYAWEYPPNALLIVYPLALLPYLWSLTLWLVLGAALYLTALWRILPRPLTLWAGLAYPAVLVTIGHGQNALLTTGLLGWGVLLLHRRPVTAGILFGILAFKPQLALLVPVALIAIGQWRAIGAAMFTLLVLAITSDILFGSCVWAGFRANLPFAGQMLESRLGSLLQIRVGLCRSPSSRRDACRGSGHPGARRLGIGGDHRLVLAAFARYGNQGRLSRSGVAARLAVLSGLRPRGRRPGHGVARSNTGTPRRATLGTDHIGGKRDSAARFPANRRLYARPARPLRCRRPSAGGPCAHAAG